MKKYFATTVAMALIIFAACSDIRASELIEVKNISDSSTVKLILKINGDAKTTSFVLSEPARLVIDIMESQSLVALAEQKFEDPLIKGVRIGKPNPETVRVVLDLVFLMPYDISPYESGPSLIVRIPRKFEERKRSREPLPGIMYSVEEKMTSVGPLTYHILEIDINKPNATLGMCIGEDKLGGLERLTSMVKRKGASIGVNGGYFNTENGRPIDLLVFMGKALTLPDRFRGFFGVDKKGKPVFIRPSAEIGVRADGQNSFYVHRLNVMPSKTEIAIFTPEHGEKTGTSPERREVIVRGDVIVGFNDGNASIPTDGYVVSVNDNSHEFLKPLAVGMGVKLIMSSYPDIRDIAYGVSAGPMLVKEGVLQTNLIEDFSFTSQILTAKYPRTAVGRTSGNRLIFVVVEGRSSRSVGMTLEELAALMKSLGAVDAVNLDGGGSSAIVIGDKIMNEIPGGAERKIANGFLFYYKSN